jgi:hypothetical protein
MGFRECCLYKPNTPVLCDDSQGKYLWQGLGDEAVVAPSDSAVRIGSTDVAPVPKPSTSWSIEPTPIDARLKTRATRSASLDERPAITPSA